MVWYCLVTFSTASLLFLIRHLLLRDASISRISKAADYVPVVEVRACSGPPFLLCALLAALLRDKCRLSLPLIVTAAVRGSVS